MPAWRSQAVGFQGKEFHANREKEASDVIMQRTRVKLEMSRETQGVVTNSRKGQPRLYIRVSYSYS